MIFSAKNIQKSFGHKKVIDGIDVEFDRKNITGILGPNGAGKTTLFSILIGVEFPDTGTITLGDNDITFTPMYKRARAGLVYLPQDTSVFRGLNVEDNIRSVLELKNKDSNVVEEKLDNLLREFSIINIRKSRTTSISGGERRKVEIARALAADPSFLLLDEPFSGIDPISVGEIMDIIIQLQEMGIGIIITDHNVRETLAILDVGYIIFSGKVLFKGTPREIVENEESRDRYLGKNFL